jgi:hypothetical protein
MGGRARGQRAGAQESPAKAMTRRRPDVQPCGERHEPYLHCLTCNLPPIENPDRLQGPTIGTVCLYQGKRDPEPVRVIVTERSYVWAPGDPAYHGGARRYDWKIVRFVDTPARSLCVDDKDLVPA